MSSGLPTPTSGGPWRYPVDREASRWSGLPELRVIFAPSGKREGFGYYPPPETPRPREWSLGMSPSGRPGNDPASDRSGAAERSPCFSKQWVPSTSRAPAIESRAGESGQDGSIWLKREDMGWGLMCGGGEAAGMVRLPKNTVVMAANDGSVLTLELAEFDVHHIAWYHLHGDEVASRAKGPPRPIHTLRQPHPGCGAQGERAP